MSKLQAAYPPVIQPELSLCDPERRSASPRQPRPDKKQQHRYADHPQDTHYKSR